MFNQTRSWMAVLIDQGDDSTRCVWHRVVRWLPPLAGHAGGCMAVEQDTGRLRTLRDPGEEGVSILYVPPKTSAESLLIGEARRRGLTYDACLGQLTERLRLVRR